MLWVREMLVYRDTRSDVRSNVLLTELGEWLATEPLSVAPVIIAGTLECALADASHSAAEGARELTDAVTHAWLSGEPAPRARARELLASLPVPDTLAISKPEGFAFYALDPGGFRSLASELALGSQRPCAVIGVRSIGTTLSAIVRAELVKSGVSCTRLTVRPTGHPWERRLSFRGPELKLLERIPTDAEYVVVDEGPGLSGSTLLAVCEALSGRGVPDDRIHVFCSHAPDPASLLAKNAATRWSRFRVHPVSDVIPKGDPGHDMSGGSWRALCYEDESAWPGSWVEHERVKFLSRDQRELLKFAGYPPYDRLPFVRATLLAEAGFSPRVTRATPGYFAYRWVRGRPLDGRVQSGGMLQRIAAYLTFRARAFQSKAADTTRALVDMARLNIAESVRMELPPNFELELRTPVYVDGRMMPFEWVREGGRVYKTDAVDHGDDDLFPGPTDVAWDLAGTIAEWNMNTAETDFLLREYARLSGDDPRPRLLPYLITYLSFRVGVMSFAARNAAESERTRGPRRRYVERLLRALFELR